MIRSGNGICSKCGCATWPDADYCEDCWEDYDWEDGRISGITPIPQPRKKKKRRRIVIIEEEDVD